MSEKTKQEIPLYKFNLYGLLIIDLTLVRADYEKSDSIKKIGKELLYQNARSTENNDSSEKKFYLILLERLYQIAHYEEFLSFSSIFIYPLGFHGINLFTLFFPWMDSSLSYNGFQSYFLEEPLYENFLKCSYKYKEMIIKLFNSVDNELKSLLIFRLKMGIEEYYQFTYPTIQYEIERRQNIGNLDEVVLQTLCENCENLNLSGSRYCNNCGTGLDDDSTSHRK